MTKDNAFMSDVVLEFAQKKLNKTNLRVWKACDEFFIEDIDKKKEYLVCFNENDEIDDLWVI